MSAAAIAMFCAEVPEKGLTAARAVLESGQIASGPLVGQFERAISVHTQRSHTVVVSDMSHALTVALRLAGIEPGDEVLTLAFSCMSSNSPIANVGAVPVWVDLDPATGAMSCDDLLQCIGPRSKAVTLYHVCGYPGPSEEVARICKDHGLVFIEDCNNAWGAQIDGRRKVGSLGDYAVHSFYPNRHVNALEGGALACPDAASAERARRLRRFGIDLPSFRDSRGEIDPLSGIEEVGWSASMSQLNAAVGLESLEDVGARLDRQRQIASRYDNAFRTLKHATAVRVPPGAASSYWTYMLLVKDRDDWLAQLKARGIAASTVHRRNDGYSGFRAARRNLPGTEVFSDQMLAIPCGWWLSDDDAGFVVDAITALDER